MGQKLVSKFEDSKFMQRECHFLISFFSMSSLKSHYYRDFFMENVLFFVVAKFLEPGILKQCNKLILA